MKVLSIGLVLALLAVFSVDAQERGIPFPQESRIHFTEKDGLPDKQVLAVCLDGEAHPVVAIEGGLTTLRDGAWAPFPAPSFPARFLSTVDGVLYAADSAHVARFDGAQWLEAFSVEDRQVTGLFACPGQLLVATSTGLYVLQGEESRWYNLEDHPHPVRAAAAGPQGALVVGTAEALLRYDAQAAQWAPQYPADARYRWAPREVGAVAFDSEGRLWFGAQQGAGVRETDGTWRLFTGAEGLPFHQFVSATAAPDGSVWFTTERGAIRRGEGLFSYRFSRRWLLDDRVNAIAVEASGTAWIGTPAGLTRIERKPMTLDEKSVYFTAQTEARHNRDGFIADCALKERFEVDSWQPKISDNDGEYTACYGAAQAFRYAATGEAEAKALAARSFDRCKWLVDITGTGMPARVIIPADWHEPVNEQYGDEYNQRKRQGDPFWKLITPRFVTSADGKHLWKCDTSSDELAGHFFFYGIYYDLAAETEDEKERVRQTVRAVTDHLIENGYLLRDHDGLPTRWGNHSPEFVNSVHGWDQRGLNSMMMLSYLKVAEHVTGDAKYAEAARYLRDEHQYHINAMHSKEFFPPENVVPWDNNLCLLSWYGLMKYETDPELMLMWRRSCEYAWQHVSKQKSALWNLLYQACSQRFAELASGNAFDGVFPEFGPYTAHTVNHFSAFDARLQDTLETLRGTPLDLIGYRMDNRHRLDVRFDNTPGAQDATVDKRGTYGWHYDGRALPIEERGHVRQDRDNFNLNACEDDGWAEHEGTLFLLPYWMGVHHGFIK